MLARGVESLAGRFDLVVGGTAGSISGGNVVVVVVGVKMLSCACLKHAVLCACNFCRRNNPRYVEKRLCARPFGVRMI